MQQPKFPLLTLLTSLFITLLTFGSAMVCYYYLATSQTTWYQALGLFSGAILGLGFWVWYNNLAPAAVSLYLWREQRKLAKQKNKWADCPNCNEHLRTIHNLLWSNEETEEKRKLAELEALLVGESIDVNPPDSLGKCCGGSSCCSGNEGASGGVRGGTTSALKAWKEAIDKEEEKPQPPGKIDDSDTSEGYFVPVGGSPSGGVRGRPRSVVGEGPARTGRRAKDDASVREITGGAGVDALEALRDKKMSDYEDTDVSVLEHRARLRQKNR